ncbi:cytochrome P450 [Kitasatospora sp. MAA19]|uniref:cytochrome P450 family protein n=1 Tax=Kitasatospora sp. MAA19 TaxID=3035090 RepID=UPI0024758DF9|nr:cytochrome P450 [Kitasatospora sp. MAA19]MDH6705925.1 cytochrome P450 [Kitasatospora sp. MAA19]
MHADHIRTEHGDTEHSATDPEFADGQFYADPHAAYRRWRTEGGARKVRFGGAAGLEGWVVTGHAECRAALADPRLSKKAVTEAFAQHVGNSEGGPGRDLMTHMLNSDPPEHTRLRKLVQQAYTGRQVATLRPMVERHVGALLDQLDGLDSAELISEFALPLPLAVVFELFGAPQAERENLQVRGNAVDTGPQDDGGADGEVSVETAEGMADYLRALVDHKRTHPGDDLISELLAAQADGDRLTEAETTSMAFLLAIAGHQSTVNLIANGIHALLGHTEQLAALRANPELLPGAIEEVLRYESPFSIASLRRTTEPVTIAGTTIPAGEFVQIALLAANRDPAVFADPDRFDITRPDATRHLAFGHGIHHCLGAQLGRLQAEVAFSELLRRFPALRLAEPAAAAQWQENPRHRGLLSLRVLLH